MTAIKHTSLVRWAAWTSLVIPGSGQFLLERRWRGITIFFSTPILAFLVNWALTNLKIGLVNLGSLQTSWLWLPFLLFWAWNVLDARYLSRNQRFSGLPGILFAAVILYFLAWNVTDIKLDRLVSRFNDAKLVAWDLINPDILSTVENGEVKTCGWDCLVKAAKAKLAGQEPEAPIALSENIGDILGRTVQKTAPKWQVSLGLAAPDEEVATFQPGKLIETIAIGLMATLFSTLLAIPLSFLAAHNVMSRVPGGMVVYYIMRTLLNIVRAVDTFVWGLMVIVWVGLGSFAGVIALTIHSMAALGKLYSEEIEHIDLGPVEAVQATGANLFQIIRYAVIPQIIPPFLAYTLLRWDINMRSATVVGFVAGGGIGFFVVETIRLGAYQQYAAALWTVAVVIILVDFLSARWREAILVDKPKAERDQEKKGWRAVRTWVFLILGVALFAYCWDITQIKLSALFEPAPTFLRLIKDFLELDLSQNVLDTVIKQIIITVFQALLATTFGAILAIPFSFLAAKNLTGKNRLSAWLYYITRSLFNILRSIEALLYVAIFVFWVGIGSFAGTLALAVTTFALIGKLFSEAIENIDYGPMEAIRATGANWLQTIYYAILPQIVPPFVSYLIYQWDINIRMATIIGFAGGGGIGLTLSTYFGMLQYHKAGTVIACIVIIVALMDFASAKLREKLV
ncbi:MAG TPA: phosphonate ABC transporter, permease protein PhnE [Anaerolineaceae bacterium]